MPQALGGLLSDGERNEGQYGSYGDVGGPSGYDNNRVTLSSSSSTTAIDLLYYDNLLDSMNIIHCLFYKIFKSLQLTRLWQYLNIHKNFE